MPCRAQGRVGDKVTGLAGGVAHIGGSQSGEGRGSEGKLLTASGLLVAPPGCSTPVYRCLLLLLLLPGCASAATPLKPRNPPSPPRPFQPQTINWIPAAQRQHWGGWVWLSAASKRDGALERCYFLPTPPHPVRQTQQASAATTTASETSERARRSPSYSRAIMFGLYKCPTVRLLYYAATLLSPTRHLTQTNFIQAKKVRNKL